MEQHIIGEPIHIAGLAIITTNADGSAARDIPALWERFGSMDIGAQLTGLTGTDIYCVYTAYEGDYLQPYTTILGYRISEPMAALPDGYAQVSIKPGTYRQFRTNAPIAENAVFQAWLEIWNSDMVRAYTTDFEIYDTAQLQQGIAKTDIFVALSV